jgi:hypothetical protein
VAALADYLGLESLARPWASRTGMPQSTRAHIEDALVRGEAALLERFERVPGIR